MRGVGASVPTPYVWSGAAEALARLTDAFYGRVREGELLAPLFADLPPDHATRVAAWMGEIFGGPPANSPVQGGCGHMVAEHLGQAITEPQRRRWVNLMQDAADDAGLPVDAEFRSAFLACVEWGTRLAVHFSGQDAGVPDERAVPRWTGSSAPPYREG